MAIPYHDIQTSFTGGEIALDLHSRIDLAKYKTSAKTIRNMISSPHGSVYNRPGTYLVSEVKNDGVARIVQFIFSTTVSYALEFGANYIRFYKNGAQIQAGGGGAYEVVTPYAVGDLFSLKFERSADTLYIAHNNYPPQTLQRFGDNSWVLSAYSNVFGPFMTPNFNTALTMSDNGIHLTASAPYFQPGMANGQFRINQFVANGLLTGTYTGTQTGVLLYTPEISGSLGIGTLIGYLPCATTWRLLTTGTWTGKIAIEQSVDGIVWTVIQTFTSNADTNINTFASVDTTTNNGQPFYLRVNVFVHASGTLNVTFTSDSFSYYKYITLGSYISSTQMNVASDTTSLVLAGATSLWSEGSWSTYRGWPGVVKFCQDRLVWGNTPTEPQTLWMTVTSNYVSFVRNTPLIDSDGITVPLNSRSVNPIQSLVAFLNNLIVFTSGAEASITSTTGGALTPNTIFVKWQSYRGSGPIDPIVIGQRILFASPRGSCIRDMEYQFYKETFESDNISLLADHLFKGFTLVDMAYQQEPDSILWAVRNDGVLLSLTYMRDQEVLAWNHHDTQGTFESVCTIPGANVDEVWFIVNRSGKRFIERMLLRTLSTDPSDQYFVDCGIGYSGAAMSSLSGFSHLNGLMVAINAGGFVKPQQLVSGGVVSLGGTYTKAQIGLPYTSDLELLHSEVPMQNGTQQGRKYQINRAVIRVIRSVGGYIGNDLITMDAIQGFRDPSLSASTPTPLLSGFLASTIPANNDAYQHVAYRQLDPMPVTIIAVLPLVSTGESV